MPRKVSGLLCIVGGVQEAFERIYRDDVWGGGSGPGSDPNDAAELLSWILAKLAPGDALLDAGCGDGRLASRIAPGCGRYVGVDLSPSALAKARQRLPRRFRLVCGTIDDVEGSWDWVLIKDVIQHLPWSEVGRLLTEARRKARKGVLIVDDFPPTSLDDIRPGEYRPVDPRQPPLSLPARMEGLFQVGDWKKAAYVL
jgi:SAM-dependent methyltransferase